MKVLAVGWILDKSGGTRALLSIARGLAELGLEVDILALAKFSDLERWFPSLLRGVNMLTIIDEEHLLELHNVEKLIVRLALELKNMEKSYDALILSNYKTAIAGRVAGVIAKSFYFLEDFPAFVIEKDGAKFLSLYFETLKMNFKGVLCASNYLCSLLRMLNPAMHSVVIGAGIDPKIFYPKRSPKKSCRPKVMSILRKEKYKGAPIAVSVTKQVAESIPIEAIFIGQNSYIRSLLKDSEHTLRYEVFEDPGDEELAKLYNSSDVFLYTSLVEGFGLPPLEAMACGTPVVASDCLGVRDYAVNEFNSFIVKPWDIAGLVGAVRRLLEDPELRMLISTRGLETAKQWTWEKIVKKIYLFMGSHLSF